MYVVLPCDTCAFATVCQMKDTYAKLLEHRDKVLCKCGDSSNNIDLTKPITVFVEHRYVDGPNLKKLYRELGLSSPTHCCLTPYNRCPLYRGHQYAKSFDSHHPGAHAFEGPTVSAACGQPLGWLSTVHGYPQIIWDRHNPKVVTSSCNRCSHKSTKVLSNYMDIALTPYSTFLTQKVDSIEGGTISRSDVEIQVDGYVVDTTRTQDSWVIYNEETVVVIYYRYVGKTKLIVPTTTPQPMTIEELRERGLLHNLDIFYNDAPGSIRPRTQPSYKDGSIMRVSIETAIGAHYIASSSGGIMYRPSDALRFCVDLDSPRYVVADTCNLPHGVKGYPTSIDLTNGNYARIVLAKGDIICFTVHTDKNYVLDIPLMKTICPSFDVTKSFACHIRNSDEFVYKFYVKIDDEDIALPIIAVDKSLFCDVIHTPTITYHNMEETDTKWNSTEICSLRFAHIGFSDIVRIPTRPRIWSGLYVDDSTGNYDTPGDLPIPCNVIRNGYNLIGFTSDLSARNNFDPLLKLTSPDDLKTGVVNVFFGSDPDQLEKSQYAVWKADTAAMSDALDNIIHKIDPSAAEIVDCDVPLEICGNLIFSCQDTAPPPDDIEIFEATGEPPEATNIMTIGTLNVNGMTMIPNYSLHVPFVENLTKNIIDTINEYLTENNLPFECRMYLLPSDGMDASCDIANVIPTFSRLPFGLTYMSKPRIDEDDNHEDVTNDIENPDDTMNNETDERPSDSSDTIVAIDCEEEFLFTDKTELKGNGHTNNLVIVLYPKHLAGLSLAFAAFVATRLDIVVNPVDLNVTLVTEKSILRCDCNKIHLDDVLEVRWIHPQHIGDADSELSLIENDDGTFGLTGKNSEFFRIGTLTYTRAHPVNLDYISDGQIYNHDVFLGNHFDMSYIPIELPDGVNFNKITVTNTHSTREILWRNQNGTLELETQSTQYDGLSIHVDAEKPNAVTIQMIVNEAAHIMIETIRGNPDASISCARCDGYVDMQLPEYAEWFEWQPSCKKYTPNF